MGNGLWAAIYWVELRWLRRAFGESKQQTGHFSISAEILDIAFGLKEFEWSSMPFIHSTPLASTTYDLRDGPE